MAVVFHKGSVYRLAERDYYKTDTVIPPPLKEIIRRWAEERDKPYNYNHGHWYTPQEVWPYREYTWTRDDARNPPEKWDELKEALLRDGWAEEDPALFVVGGDGSAKLGEGNHRLAIAIESGLEEIPVAFTFQEDPVR